MIKIGRSKMQLNEKKTKIVNELLTLVVQEDIRPGQNLPAERKLAQRFDVSRNSIREVIRILEERGVVEVYPGSGCYLKKRIDNENSWEEIKHSQNPEIIINQLEARFMLVPRVGALAMERINERDIKRLEETMVRLSRAIIDRNFNSIITEDNRFREILAETTGNKIISKMVRQLELNNHLTWELFTEFPEEGMNRIFACYVQTLNAIRSRDRAQVQQHMENTILTMCSLLSEFSSLEFPEHLQEQIRTCSDMTDRGVEDENQTRFN